MNESDTGNNDDEYRKEQTHISEHKNIETKYKPSHPLNDQTRNNKSDEHEVMQLSLLLAAPKRKEQQCSQYCQKESKIKQTPIPKLNKQNKRNKHKHDHDDEHHNEHHNEHHHHHHKNNHR